ncbi:(R)-mandelonitrile lyase-like [Cryptomeria japonica]|uniref:(R)-mandelonitrile lyase-like n=1 Tax=Cryptomeria japonica TaxID=3369 RepID=UPI0027DA8C82|nr:(R)-mandelonitrile lyase-like [Cryptomeria japonica]
MVKEGDTLPPNDKTTGANVETLYNTTPEINIDIRNSQFTMLNTTKSGMIEFYKVIDWVYSEIDSFKNKQEDSSRKVDTLEAIGIEYPYPFMTADAQKAAARTYDYIVVGGGTAGCPLAATLSQHYSVLVLERGDSPYGNPDVETFKGFSKVFGDPKDYPYVMEGFVSEDGVQLARGRVLGGGSAINAGFYSRASSEYIQKMKWDEKLVNESYEWVEKLNAFRQYKLFPWNTAVKGGLLDAGVLPYNGYTLEHLEGTKIGASTFDYNGKRHSAADLLQYANPENIVVLLNATASRILFNLASGDLKVNGVEFMSTSDGMHYQVSLDKFSINSEVILSAGTIGSPQLLLLSGIGPTQELKKMNITTILDLPFVGKKVQDNPMVKFLVESPKPLEFAQVQVVGILDNSQLYIESASFLQQNNMTKIQYLGLVASKVAFPSSRGELWLKSKDPQDNPYVRYNYYSHPSDLKKCMLCAKVMVNLSLSSFIQEFAFTKNGQKELQFRGAKLPKGQSNDDALAKFCKDSLGTYYHYHGGCEVGLVVDKRHRVQGVPNLRVVDNSIFKYSPGTNPQATTMMLGRYMGIHILQECMNL